MTDLYDRVQVGAKIIGFANLTYSDIDPPKIPADADEESDGLSDEDAWSSVEPLALTMYEPTFRGTSDRDIQLLVDGTPPPTSRVATVRMDPQPRWVDVHVALDRRLPYHIEESHDRLTLRVHGAISRVNFLQHGRVDPYIVRGAWSQPRTELFVLDVGARDATLIESQTTIEGQPTEMFVQDGVAVVFSYVSPTPELAGSQAELEALYRFGDASHSKMTVVDLRGAEAQVLREVYTQGSYVSSRRVGDVVRSVIRGWSPPRNCRCIAGSAISAIASGVHSGV